VCVYALPFEPVVRSRIQPMVIVNDDYQSVGIVCLSVIGGFQRVARKRSISFNVSSVFIHCLIVVVRVYISSVSVLPVYSVWKQYSNTVP